MNKNSLVKERIVYAGNKNSVADINILFTTDK